MANIVLVSSAMKLQKQDKVMLFIPVVAWFQFFLELIYLQLFGVHIVCVTKLLDNHMTNVVSDIFSYTFSPIKIRSPHLLPLFVCFFFFGCGVGDLKTFHLSSCQRSYEYIQNSSDNRQIAFTAVRRR